MKTYIALLRGINVSGQKKIKMADLKALFEKLNFSNVRTYIQSGNVIFNNNSSGTNQLENKIKKAITNQYGFKVDVIIKSVKELENIISNNPFLPRKKDTDKMYVTFLSEIPASKKLSKTKEADFSPEEYFIDRKNIYLFLPKGYGRAKLNNNYFENKLKVFATTRNWKTVNKLFELAAGS